MDVSRIRLIKFLTGQGISPERYSLYTDSDYENCGIVPGTHHALHRADFSFDFGDILIKDEVLSVVSPPRRDEGEWALSEKELASFNEMRERAKKAKHIAEEAAKANAAAAAKPAESANTTEDKQNEPLPQGPAFYPLDLFNAAVSSYSDPKKDEPKHSKQRREDASLLSNIYTHKEAAIGKLVEYGTIDNLIAQFKGKVPTIKPLIYVGGPFTETVKIIEELGCDKIGPVLAMAGATHGKSNLFSNQFNILIDPVAAQSVLRMAKNNEIDLTLLPTECAKGSAYDFQSLYEFRRQIGPEFEHIANLYGQWNPTPERAITLFDLLAAMAATTDLYKGMLKSVAVEKTSDGKFRFEQKSSGEASSGPGLKMFWNEPSEDGKGTAIFNENPVMAERYVYFLQELKWTFSAFGTKRDHKLAETSEH